MMEMTIKVGAKVGDAGKIFGSVNNIQVAGGKWPSWAFQLIRKNVKIKDEPIKAIGTYEAVVVFHRDVVRNHFIRSSRRIIE